MNNSFEKRVIQRGENLVDKTLEVVKRSVSHLYGKTHRFTGKFKSSRWKVFLKLVIKTKKENWKPEKSLGQKQPPEKFYKNRCS